MSPMLTTAHVYIPFERVRLDACRVRMTRDLPDYDLYVVLGVRPDARSAEIKAAHRAMAKRLHPDVASQSPRALVLMKRVNVARDVLMDPERRGEYDAVRMQLRSVATGPASPVCPACGAEFMSAGGLTFHHRFGGCPQ